MKNTFIVSLSDCFESVLSRGIPYLHFDFFIAILNGFDFEIDALNEE
jgi:hypothetical protein